MRSEVPLGRQHGLPDACVISCDDVMTIPLGALDEVAQARLDRALRDAPGIAC